jgi:NAD(P)H-flavin reductase
LLFNSIDGYKYGQITEDFIKANSGGINKIFYICGPPPMMDAMVKHPGQTCESERLYKKNKF